MSIPETAEAPVFRLSNKGGPEVVGMVVERLSVERRERFPLALAVDVKAIRETLQLLAARNRR